MGVYEKATRRAWWLQGPVALRELLGLHHFLSLPLNAHIPDGILWMCLQGSWEALSSFPDATELLLRDGHILCVHVVSEARYTAVYRVFVRLCYPRSG